MRDDVNVNGTSSASQKSQILAHLQAGNSITAIEALYQFGSLRLSGRIKDLRDEGYDIKSEFIQLPNGKHVKRYYM